MKRESFNSGWLFCRGSGTALDSTAAGCSAMAAERLWSER